MSATDELRRSLDERGVEHEDRDNWGTWWSYNGTEACYVMSHGGIFYLNAKSVTPEQAIEATLGRGECELTHTRDKPRSKALTLTCSECGWWTDRINNRVNYCPNCGRKVRV